MPSFYWNFIAPLTLKFNPLQIQVPIDTGVFPVAHFTVLFIAYFNDSLV